MSIFQKIKSFFIPKKMLFIIGISVCLFLFFPMNSLAQQNVYQKVFYIIIPAILKAAADVTVLRRPERTRRR